MHYYYYSSIHIFIPFFTCAAISEIYFYIQFLSRELYTPSPLFIGASFGSNSIDENDVFSFDKGYRRKWPFNGNWEERERERIHGHLTRRITFFAGIAGLSLRNLFELFTRIYTMPVCRGHNFEIRRQFLAVMSSTIHSRMARNPIFTLPCTNLT